MLKRFDFKHCINFLKGLSFLLIVMLASCTPAINKEVAIYHTNDVHGRGLVGADHSFDYAHLAGFLEAAGERETFMYLDAGDTIQGLPIAGVSKGLNVILALNLLPLKAMVIGNHEFDYGVSNLETLIKAANFPIISANVKRDDQVVFDPYVIEVIDGIKFGIFGLTTPETTFKTNPNYIEGYEFADLIQTSQEMVELLRSREKVDYVIALSHVGREGDYPTTDLAQQVSGIDLIIDGHDHEALPDGLVVNNTLIVETGEHAENLGKVLLTFSSDNKLISQVPSLIPAAVVNESEPSPEVQQQLAQMTEANRKIFQEVIGFTPVDLDGSREVRRGESLLGQLITDSMINLTGADVVLLNGGGIRESIPAGEVKREDVLGVLPFANNVVTQTIRGSILKDALEHGVSKYPEAHGGFPHVAGMTFTADMTKLVGERVRDVLINGEPLDLDKEYVLATIEFLSIGGDDYTMLIGHKVSEFISNDESFALYLAKLVPEDFVFKPRIKIIQ